MKMKAIVALFLIIAPATAAVFAQEPDSGVWWPDPTRMIVWYWPKFSPPKTTETVEAYLFYAYPDGSPMWSYGPADGMEFTLPATDIPSETNSISVEVGGFRWRHLNPDLVTWTEVYYPIRVIVTKVKMIEFRDVTPDTILWLQPVNDSRIIARVKLGNYELHTNPDFHGKYRFTLEKLFGEGSLEELFGGERTLRIIFGIENPVLVRIIRPHEPEEYRDPR